MLLIREIVDILEQFAPPSLAADWDNVGLQVGSAEAQVDAVLISLDVTEAVIREAVEKGAGLIISHHPVTRGEINTLDKNNYVGGRLWAAAHSGINIYVAHTNLDVCPGGVSDVLASKLDLKGVDILLASAHRGEYKLVCFVPPSHVGSVTEAIIRAGGGVIGDYTHCTFRTLGQGTFKPGIDSRPFVASNTEVTEVEEVRLEVRVAPQILGSVVSKMIEVHPYEEVAYDVYRLEAPLKPSGFGRIGDLDHAVALGECVEICQRKLKLTTVRVCGDLSKKVERVAVCGGSGSDLISLAKSREADVLVTGDIKYHDAQLAQFLDLAIVDAGHFHTELPVVESLALVLKEKIKEKKKDLRILMSETCTSPWLQH